LRLDWLELSMIGDKTGQAFQDYWHGVPLGGVESSTPLSSEMARLNAEGYAGRLIERLRSRFPNELPVIVAQASRLEGLGQSGSSAKSGDQHLSKRRGRPPKTNLADDRKLYDAWKSSGLTQKDFARARKISFDEVEAACKRERTRRSRSQKPKA
jgi:hypothetical protein